MNYYFSGPTESHKHPMLYAEVAAFIKLRSPRAASK